ncbi:MAG TPA: FAD:protein FMN transferase [Candidatus Limnocylindrales bacterium]|nr:FAD:protein FMN transferase [Candidatus Limnocylindrales bacterium]
MAGASPPRQPAAAAARPGADPTEASGPPGSTDDASTGTDRLASFLGRALGSSLRLTVRVPEPATGRALAAAELAWAAVLAEFDEVDAALSRFRDDSELTMLNRLAGSGAVVAVSGRTRRALAAIDRAFRMTDHRFDAGVLGGLERIGEHGAALDRTVPPRPIPDASGRRFRVHVPPVPVDMGGIGKGLALRWASERAHAVLPEGTGLLLEAGGDLVARGTPPGDGWRVGVEDPAAEDVKTAEPVVVIAVAEGAVATSSVRVRNWIGPDGRPVHHLLDPRTGEPARGGLIAVTVAAPDPAWAEVWSKALFLDGREGIAADARARGMAAWWVDDRGMLGMTPEARVRTAWAAEDRLG